MLTSGSISLSLRKLIFSTSFIIRDSTYYFMRLRFAAIEDVINTNTHTSITTFSIIEEFSLCDLLAASNLHSVSILLLLSSYYYTQQYCHNPLFQAATPHAC